MGRKKNEGYAVRIAPYIKQIEQWHQEGKDTKYIAEQLGYNPSYFRDIIKKHDELNAVMHAKPQKAIDDCRRTLFKMANGYEAPSENTETITYDKNGMIVSRTVKKVTKTYQPNIRALCLWLVNNDSDFITDRAPDSVDADNIGNDYYKSKDKSNGAE